MSPSHTIGEERLLPNTEDVTVLALCEQEALILKPDVLYRFEVAIGCSKCESLAGINHYGQHLQGCVSCYKYNEENHD